MSKQIRILIIDDEPVVCSSCKRFLGEEEGYEVETAVKGKDGLEFLDSKDYDIVITDLKMPEISGMEILEYIKDKYPNIKVIMITGLSTIENAKESIKRGAFDYIPKPFTPDELLDAIKSAS